MSLQQLGLAGPLASARAWLENTHIAGRSLWWYLTGWRLGLIFLLVAVVLPSLLDQTLVTSAISIFIYALLALGLNIVVGYAGLLDLGYVAFFVIGSYTVAVGTGGILQDAHDNPLTIPSYPFWLLLPLAAVLAGVFGVLLGAPTLRLRGDYLAIVTLGFGEIVPIVFQNLPFFFGNIGMSALPPADVGPITFSDPLNATPFYFLTLIVLVLVILAVTALRDSSLGRAWIAIREDETAAAAAGVNLVRTKLLAFSMGAVVGGIGGALNAAFVTTIAPSDFNFGISITILIMIVLGGIGSIPGVILGAALLRFFDVYLLGTVSNNLEGIPAVATFLAGHDINTAKLLIYGLILIVMILLRPQGLIPDRRRSRELKGIGAAPEDTSAVGLLALEEAGISSVGESAADETTYAGTGSDAQGREG
ncbi:MAG TPA: branched-chain amino acid ABC transporter permease [Ktedonobacterales bacterium]|nr:branched-chain amino acid ABC transporter permease [Ktedonobacterales bacterium]